MTEKEMVAYTIKLESLLLEAKGLLEKTAKNQRRRKPTIVRENKKYVVKSDKILNSHVAKGLSHRITKALSKRGPLVIDKEK